MRNSIAIIICILISQFAQVEPIGASTSGPAPAPVPVVAPPAPSSVPGINEATIRKEAIYSLVVSRGNKSSDWDVFIARKFRNIYSFKYCQAHKDTQATAVAQIRIDTYIDSEPFGHFQANRERLSQLFYSPLCKTIGEESYGLSHNLDISTSAGPFDMTNGGWNSSLASFILSFPAFIKTLSTIEKTGALRAQNNTISISRWLTSASFPRGRWAISLALVTSAVGSGAYAVHSEKQGKQAAAFNKPVNAFIIRREDGNEEHAMVIVDSMDDFLKDFKSGLEIAINERDMVAL